MHEAKGGAYYLLGYYGSLEDAQKIFEEVKQINSRDDTEEWEDQWIMYVRMIESLGLFLMRDRFMPQKDRALMTEIEEFLERCAELVKGEGCWTAEDQQSIRGTLCNVSFDALSDGGGQKIKAYLKKIEDYLETHSGREERRYAELQLKRITKNTECLDSRAENIRKYFPPVQPEAEIE